MKKDIKKFRGVLKLGYLDSISAEKIDYLINSKIIEDVSEDDDEYDGIEDNFEFDYYFTYNKREYKFSDRIRDDFYLILQEYIRRLTFKDIEKAKTRINLGLKGRLDINKKRKFLEKNFKKLYTSTDIYQGLDIILNKQKAKYYFNIVYNEFSFEPMKYYLTSKNIDNYSYFKYRSTWGRDTFFNEENYVIKKFIIAYKINELEHFIKNEIQKLEDKSKPTKTGKSRKPLYQVLFIDILKKELDKDKITIENLEKYLGDLTGYDFKDENLQLECFKELLKLNKNIYNSLSASKLGEKIHEITNKDEKTLRDASAVITKKSKDYTDSQKELFKNKAQIINKIHGVLKALK